MWNWVIAISVAPVYNGRLFAAAPLTPLRAQTALTWPLSGAEGPVHTTSAPPNLSPHPPPDLQPFAQIFFCLPLPLIANNFIHYIKMITTDQLREVVEREQALRGYL